MAPDKILTKIGYAAFHPVYAEVSTYSPGLIPLQFQERHLKLDGQGVSHKLGAVSQRENCRPETARARSQLQFTVRSNSKLQYNSKKEYRRNPKKQDSIPVTDHFTGQVKHVNSIL